jgi:predicted ATPase
VFDVAGRRYGNPAAVDVLLTDPTSLEVFGRLVAQIAPLRVLLIVTFRLEFNPPWIGLPDVTAMTINRLPMLPD